ncbi:MAG: hypothetical protein IJU76_09455 [Desulfovibrionaceae bacterium]|nr:hypothetical protein [Desulfovibrionaceae bacterium]
MQKELAEILSKNQRKVLEDVFSAKEFVTKTDLIQETGTLSATVEKLRSDTKADIEKLRSETKADLVPVKS